MDYLDLSWLLGQYGKQFPRKEPEMKYLKTDAAKCKGVRACEKVCSMTFFKKEDPGLSSIKITGKSGGFDMNVCNQCGKCIPVCPVEALYRNKAGIVLVKKDRCVGCFMCVGFCPSLSMRRDDGQREPFKCVACGQCVKECPKGALQLAESILPQNEGGQPA